jgi:hypothetical protein
MYDIETGLKPQMVTDKEQIGTWGRVPKDMDEAQEL